MEVLVRALIQEGKNALSQAEIADADNDSWLLAEYIFGITKASFYMKPDMRADEKTADRYREAIRQRAEKIPLQYITGHQEFMGLDFKVNSNVLIPRQDTELLVETAAGYINGLKRPVKVLDLCTGSGCIAISIDRLCPDAEVTAADISEQALQIAKENNHINNCNVKFIQSDLFQNVVGMFDVIISNPPYIETDVIKGLMDEVKNHEPLIALDGDRDGLKFYRNIIEGLDTYLCDGGKIFFEIGYNQGKSVPELFNKCGYKNVMVLKDLSGNDRVVSAGKE